MVVLDKEGKFITGVCHPKKRTDLIKGAGMGWVRMDVPFPYEPGKKGEISARYAKFRERCAELAAEGLRAMCITPYPRAFVNWGADPASASWLTDVRDACRFLAADLAKYNVGWQITNEMYVFHFRIPLLPEETIPFLIAGLEGVREGAPDAILGHNSVTAAGSEYDLSVIGGLKAYEPIMDYIGLDTYKGTWADGEADDIVGDINKTYELTKMPVLVQEFGFASAGDIMCEADVLGYLKERGYGSRDEVMADPKPFILRLPYYVAKRIFESPQADWGVNSLRMMPHLLKKWPGSSKIYRHTPEGQAAFYGDLLGKMIANPYTCGAVIYCWSDDALCFNCYNADCPCETAWGITYNDETPKPAYGVIKEIFNAVK